MHRSECGRLLARGIRGAGVRRSCADRVSDQRPAGTNVFGDVIDRAVAHGITGQAKDEINAVLVAHSMVAADPELDTVLPPTSR